MANRRERMLVLVYVCKQGAWSKSYDFNEERKPRSSGLAEKERQGREETNLKEGQICCAQYQGDIRLGREVI